MSSELEERLERLIERYAHVTAPTVFRLQVLADLMWVEEGNGDMPVLIKGEQE